VREGNWKIHFESLLKEGNQDLIEEYVVAYEVGKENCMIEEFSIKRFS